MLCELRDALRWPCPPSISAALSLALLHFCSRILTMAFSIYQSAAAMHTDSSHGFHPLYTGVPSDLDSEVVGGGCR
jgi:hypothetical protein